MVLVKLAYLFNPPQQDTFQCICVSTRGQSFCPKYVVLYVTLICLGFLKL